MGIKDLISLPNIGDLITCTEVWDKVFSKDKYPYGLVTSVLDYDTLLILEGKEELIGTLAFPLKDADALNKSGKVYVVRWSLKNSSDDNSFRLIHEEWFHNKSFIIATRKKGE